MTWILYKAVKGESKMAVEFSRRPLLSLLLSLRLSIFNLNCSCNWLEGQQGGTLLVGCAMPHGSQRAGSSLPLKKHFCCNAEISSCIRRFISLHFRLSFLIMTVETKRDLKKAIRKLIFVSVMQTCLWATLAQKEAQMICPQHHGVMHCQHF